MKQTLENIGKYFMESFFIFLFIFNDEIQPNAVKKISENIFRQTHPKIVRS